MSVHKPLIAIRTGDRYRGVVEFADSTSQARLIPAPFDRDRHFEGSLGPDETGKAEPALKPSVTLRTYQCRSLHGDIDGAVWPAVGGNWSTPAIANDFSYRAGPFYVR